MKLRFLFSFFFLLAFCFSQIQAQNNSLTAEYKNLHDGEYMGTSALLWDNMPTPATTGIVSGEWGGLPAGSNQVLCAEDFEIPATVTWTIDEIFASGFYSAGESDVWGVNFYDDAGGSPGTLLQSETVTVIPGDPEPSGMLSNPVTLMGGNTYWVSIFGINETASTLDQFRWNWYASEDPEILSEPYLRDDAGFFGGTAGWTSFSSLGIGDYNALIFQLYGTEDAPSDVFMDDFDSYNAGEQLACQNPNDWTTWSEDPCNATEDPYISDVYAWSGTNSTVIVQNNDLVYPTGTKTSGTWYMSMLVFIPAGNSGYFNAMTTFDSPNFEWAVEIYFDQGGTGSVEADQSYSFNWLEDVWQQVVLMVDLDNDMASFSIGTSDPLTEVASWQYTQGGTLAQQLDVFDFFGATANDEMYFDNFYFGNEEPGIIPVELTSFTADVNDGNVTLNWTTASEINNQMFEIERKVEDGEFTRVGYVEGKGTTSEEQTYVYVDNGVTPGNYTYRLKQLDFNGGFDYSEAIEVEVEAPLAFALEQNYPNPFNPSTTINYSLAAAGKVNISVYNLLGQKITTLVDGFQEAGHYDVNFDASNLSSGVYFYKIVTDNFVMAKKMILSK